jgi:hypothetical protein
MRYVLAPTGTSAGIAISVRPLIVIALVVGLSFRAVVGQPAQAARVAALDFYTPSPLSPCLESSLRSGPQTISRTCSRGLQDNR